MTYKLSYFRILELIRMVKIKSKIIHLCRKQDSIHMIEIQSIQLNNCDVRATKILIEAKIN